MKIGILGGAFDPPHSGHLIIAEVTSAALGLEQVLFIPYSTGPHQPEGAIAPAEHRFEMVRLAVQGHPSFSADNREVERGGTSYTVSTLRELQSEHSGVTLVLIMGSDQFALIHTWKEWETIVDLAEIAVIARPGYRASDAGSAPGERVTWVEHPPIPVSSTGVRGLAAEGKEIRSLVPDTVARYIEEHRLYL